MYANTTVSKTVLMSAYQGVCASVSLDVMRCGSECQCVQA